MKHELASVIIMLCIASLRFWLPFLCMAVVATWSFNARLLSILTSGSMWWSCTRTGTVEEVGDGYDVVKVRWATLDRHKGNRHGVPSKAFGMPSRTCAKNIRKSIECWQRFLINYCTSSTCSLPHRSGLLAFLFISSFPGWWWYCTRTLFKQSEA